MGFGLLLAEDKAVAEWVFTKHNVFPMPVNRALGIVNVATKEMAGAVLLQNFNGVNLELSYYGKGTFTAGIVKSIARIIALEFNAARTTVTTSKKNKRLMRSIQRFGFRLEGNQRRYFGHRDCYRNTAIRFVMFRDQIDKLAGLTSTGSIQQQG